MQLTMVADLELQFTTDPRKNPSLLYIYLLVYLCNVSTSIGVKIFPSNELKKKKKKKGLGPLCSGNVSPPLEFRAN